MNLPEMLVRMVVLIVVPASCGSALHAQQTTILSVTRQNSQLTIAWRGPAGWDHTLQSTPLLPASEWTDVLTVTAALDVNQRTVDLPAAAQNGFYRVRCTPPSGSIGPRLFFTDLESGPNTGGQDNLGAFVAVYGESLGAQRGNSTVTVGGREVARYVIWGENNGARQMDKIVVQLGPAATTGNLVVTVNGRASNPLPFTVRSGQIFFVAPDAPSASDANPGTFTQPFGTIYRPREVMQAGDIVYIRGGRIHTSDPVGPGWDTILMLDPDTGSAAGTADRPIAYVGYPGESPVLGDRAARRGILLSTGPSQSYYVLANLILTEASDPVSLAGVGHRIVGNTVFEAGFDDSGTISVNTASSQLKILGNLVRDNGDAGNKFRHGFYIGGYGTNRMIEFGWNEVRDQRGGRGIQLFGHLDNDWIDDVRIHDNWVSGSELDNIVIGGTDGSTEVIGTVHVYNNIIVGAGEAGVRVNDPQGTVVIQNNVLYNNHSAEARWQRVGAGKVTFQNNILYAAAGGAYHAFDADGAEPSSLRASHNLCFNAGPCAPWEVNSFNADPMFVDLAAHDFRLQAGSPAIDSGATTGIASDYAGVPRPQGPAPDIGAHEFSPVTGP
ncbi:MAG: right-handed parallel beta-helix repeat-containing protein [Verrucomicrobia bacterium]|nr:right-handed parallel beta-helix repeat-containing protein [Verrucomicrobiota bacterium]